MGDGRERQESEQGGEGTCERDPLEGTPYRATRLLGEGGTACVYEARPRAGGRRVAVKALKRSVAASDDAVERMRIEAEALHCLCHPNIVRVLDFGKMSNGCPYLVEERLYGRCLHKEILARGPLPAFEAIDFVCQLLAGLEVVHRLGIVHRDLKLSNLFLARDKQTRARTLKMLDFGFAKVLRIECSRARPKPMAISTRSDLFLGTPRFAAPEQVAAGYPLGPAADLYTAGLVLYSLLAGREPYHAIAGQTDLLMAQVQQELSSPGRHALEPIAAELERFLAKAVEKHPVNRFGSATEMREELASLANRMRGSTEGASTQAMGNGHSTQAVEAPPAVADADAYPTVRLDPAALADLAAAVKCAEENGKAVAIPGGNESLLASIARPSPGPGSRPSPNPGRRVDGAQSNSLAGSSPGGRPLPEHDSAGADCAARVSERPRLSPVWAAGLGVLVAMCMLFWLILRGAGEP